MIKNIINIGRFVFNHNLQTHKSFCKLQYILTSLFNGLFVKGFCKKVEEKDDEDGNLDTNEIGDGVGMADGKGMEDVSNELENEGQVEGLQDGNENKPDPENKDKIQEDEDDIGVEMEQDFDGDLHDFEEVDNKKKGDDSEDDIEDIEREIGDIDFNKSEVIDERMWGSDDEEQDDDNNDNQNDDQAQNDEEDDRNNNKDLNTNDKYSQVQAKQNLNDEENDDTQNKNDGDGDEDDMDENDKEKKEEETARLEYGDPLEDLDENVSDEEAARMHKDDEDEDANEEDTPHKTFELNEDKMDIDFSENDSDAMNEENDNNNTEDEIDEKALEKEFAEREEDIEKERMEDLQRGAGEIMPPNQAKDEELEFINDSDGDGDGDDEDERDDEDKEKENEQGIMDIDKEEANETEMDDDGEENEEDDEDKEDVNHPSNPDVLEPNMPDMDDEEMEQNENDLELKQQENEDADEKDANLEAENEETNETNENAMGVFGGMGDNAPVANDDKEEDNDIEMADENKQSFEQQLSDVFGEDQQQMMQDKDMGEWQPINQQNQQKRENKQNREEKKKEIDDKTNPFRSLGDALTEWKQRLDIIEQDETAEKEEIIADNDGKEEKENDGNNDGNDDEQHAHIPQDMDVDNETQALMDKRDEDDVTHLPNITDIHNDTDDLDDDDNDNQQFDDEQELLHDKSDGDDKFDPYQEKQSNAQNENESDNKEVDSKQNELKLKDLQIRSNENDEDTKQSYLDYLQQIVNDDENEENQSLPEHKYNDNDNDNNNNNDEEDEQQPEDEEDGPTAVEIAELRNNLDERLSDWRQQSSHSALQSGDEIWRQLCIVTNSLSQQLCEELRTILEPLQMSKLGGDFRTGKRINMKKVIPYIASQFRKDKIWLRRCKPHKRNYRILICIDDSESMRENSAGRLALESLCILTRALNKLEVGSIGVLSFGEAINLLHSLQQNFSDESGSFVCSQFSFAQKETKYQDLIATIINVLSNNDATWKSIQQHMEQFNTSNDGPRNRLASLSGAAMPCVSWDGSETLSLVFIISDARIQQDRKRLEQLVRIAHERKQIVLLIIVDTNDENTSIVNVKSIHVDPLTHHVHISNYLDSFPFPYYVLLKDIQTLPNVVADSLRQWFELVRQSS